MPVWASIPLFGGLRQVQCSFLAQISRNPGNIHQLFRSSCSGFFSQLGLCGLNLSSGLKSVHENLVTIEFYRR
jgi:hypothetical protein